MALLYFDKQSSCAVQPPAKKRRYQRQLAAGESSGVGLIGKMNFMRSLNEHFNGTSGDSLPINEAIYLEVIKLVILLAV